MNNLANALRYSLVGVFCAGIIGVIQGCSVEREGALFAALLLLLNFCSGPVEDAELTESNTFAFGSDFATADSSFTIFNNAAYFIKAHVTQNTTTSSQSGTLKKFRLQLDDGQAIPDLLVTFFIARGSVSKPFIEFIQTAVLDNTNCNSLTKICEIDAIGNFALLAGDYVGVHNASGNTFDLEHDNSGAVNESTAGTFLVAVISVGLQLVPIQSANEAFIQATGE